MQMIKRGPLAALALCCLAAQAFAQEKEKDVAKGGVVEGIVGLVCIAATGMVCLAVVGGAVFGLVWLIRRKQAQPRGGFEGGVGGAVSSGIDEAFERHRRAKQDKEKPEQPS